MNYFYDSLNIKFSTMSACILSTQNQETQILITIQHGHSMLEFEDRLQTELNEAGVLASGQQLECMDTDGSPITMGSVRMSCKRKKRT